VVFFSCILFWWERFGENVSQTPFRVIARQTAEIRAISLLEFKELHLLHLFEVFQAQETQYSVQKQSKLLIITVHIIPSEAASFFVLALLSFSFRDK
jgi:hypothetical protein